MGFINSSNLFGRAEEKAKVLYTKFYWTRTAINLAIKRKGHILEAEFIYGDLKASMLPTRDFVGILCIGCICKLTFLGK